MKNYLLKNIKLWLGIIGFCLSLMPTVSQAAEPTGTATQTTCTDPRDFPEPGEEIPRTNNVKDGGQVCIEGESYSWNWTVWDYPEKPCPDGFSAVTAWRCHQQIGSSTDGYSWSGVNQAWGGVGAPWAYLTHAGTDNAVRCGGALGIPNIMVPHSNAIAFFTDPPKIVCEIGADRIVSCKGTLVTINGRQACIRGFRGWNSTGGSEPVETVTRSRYEPEPPAPPAPPARTGVCGKISTGTDPCKNNAVSWKTCPTNWKVEYDYTIGNGVETQTATIEAPAYTDEASGEKKYRSRVTLPFDHGVVARSRSYIKGWHRYGVSGKLKLWHQSEDNGEWRLSDDKPFACPAHEEHISHSVRSGDNKCSGDEVTISGQAEGTYWVTAGTCPTGSCVYSDFELAPDYNPRELMNTQITASPTANTVTLSGLPRPADGQYYDYYLHLWYQSPSDSEAKLLRYNNATCGIKNENGLDNLKLPGPVVYGSPSFSCDAVTEPSKAECQALVDLHQSTNGHLWNGFYLTKSFSGDAWLTTNTPCNWDGVTCSGGKVTGLRLNGFQLVGSLSNIKDINLPNLEKLSLYGNRLTGSVPDFTNLPNLKHLDLSVNRLSGSIPDFTNLPKLEGLYLSDSRLTGSIPDFSNLPNLKNLYVDKNHLSGNVPSFVTGLSRLNTDLNCGLTADPADIAAIKQKNSTWNRNQSEAGCAKGPYPADVLPPIAPPKGRTFSDSFEATQ